jgi:hypothetical protein
MSRASLIVHSRARTEYVQFTDACTARRGGEPTYDDSTGATTPGWTALYAGPCRMSQPSSGSSSASRTTVGEAEVLLQSPEIHLPMAADLLQPGDEITITASATDPKSVGRIFRVRAVPAHANATARRYGVVERTS